MKPPENEQGRPRAPIQSGPNSSSTATSQPQETPTDSSVRLGRGSHRRDAVTCRVSLLVPAGRRTLWHYLARCPVCRAPHMGRSATLDGVTQVRKLPCGHLVAVVVARVYGGTASAA
jgi:hypothetical protein